MAELEDTLGSGELTKWYAYYQIEPFGQWRDNYHAAMVAATIVNNIGKVKNAKQINDFMLEHPDLRRKRETSTTLAIMDALAKKK